MRVGEHNGTLEVEDLPGLHWLFGLLFVGVGGLFVAGPLGLFADAGLLRWWIRVAMAALGLASVAGGGWILSRTPRSRLTVDATNGSMRLERWGFGGRAVLEWPLARLVAVQLVEGRDDEGGTIFQIHLHLAEAGRVPLSPIWAHDRDGMERVARRLAAVAGVRPINVSTPGA